MSTKPHVRHCMEILRSEYGNLFIESQEEWGRRVDAYHGKLRRTEMSVLESACEAAATRYPTKFPTAGQLLSLVIAVEQRLKADAYKDVEEGKEAAEKANNKAYVNGLRKDVIPDTSSAQEEWVEEGEMTYEKIARRWEVESKRRALDPNQPSPADVARQRFEDLHNTGIFGQTPDAKDNPPNNQPPPSAA